MSLLTNLHRCAFISMLEDTSPLRDFINREAEGLADRCLGAVLPITTFGHRKPKPSTQEWIASGPELSPIRNRLVEAFSYALRLKRWLPLTQQCFEFYTPTPGCIPPRNFVAKSDESSVEPHQVVKLCLMPGVIQYSRDLFLSDSSGVNALCGEKSIVSASEEQRKYGHVVCPALVTVAETENGTS